jgi:amidase
LQGFPQQHPALYDRRMRRLFTGGALVTALTVVALAAQSSPPATGFDLEELTIAGLQERLSSGRDTARSLAEKYLARIDAIDRKGPALRSVIEVNPDALSIADGLDAERKAGHLRGPLHGIPVLIKDNIATADRMMTTAGSLALAGARPPRDAFIVERLREEGAVILGKTNLSEWANFRSTHSSSGWSGRGGQTKNPYALDRNPSGSSSGSGAAIAANLAAAAIGTETDGSIVSPSTNNALVGIKPTLGLVSRTGIVPIAHSQDTAGPMARTVADAALVLAAISGADPADAASLPTRASTRLTRSGQAGSGRAGRPAGPGFLLRADALKGARIGVVRNRLFGYSAAADAIALEAIADMKRQGAVIVDPVTIPTLGKFDEGEFEVLLYEFKADVNTFLAWLGPASPVHSLKDVIAFNTAHADEELKFFGQEILMMAEKKGPLSDPKYTAALARNRQMAGPLGIDAAMIAHKLDALVAPTGGPAWVIDLVNGDGGTAAAPGPSTMAAVAGYPHVTVPAGFFRGLPVGISFVGRAWSDAKLIALAYAYEQATKKRRPPSFPESADLDVAQGFSPAIQRPQP